MASLKRYILVRFLASIPMLFILLTIVFIVLRWLPGDPISALYGGKLPPEYEEMLKKKLYLDRPPYEQYIIYLSKLFQGDFGTSTYTKRPVAVEILERLPATIELTIYGLLIALVIGISFGTWAAHNRGSLVDKFVRVYSIVVYALFIPWFGTILQYIFGVVFHVLPVGGRLDATVDVPPRVTGMYTIDALIAGRLDIFVNAVQHLVLPSIVLGLVLSGIFVRITRENMIVVLKKDFISFARARGIKESRILWRHALKNSLIPIITMFGLQFALLLAGAILTETTFSWPGVGSYLMLRIQYRDYPAIQGVITVYALLVILVSLVVDIVYAMIDPRIRY